MGRKSYVLIVLIILFLVVVYFNNFYTHRAKINGTSKEKYNKLKRKLNLELPANIDPFVDNTLAPPVSFGYKIVWLAIKTIESAAVLKHLNSKNKLAIQTNWEKGVEGAYKGYCFISPPVEGWTLVLNPNLGNLSTTDTRNFLKILSKEFGEAQFFGSHRIVRYGAWGRFENGEIVRAFSIADGQIDMDAGDLTALEEMYIEEVKKTMSIEDLNYYEVEGFHQILGGEDQVMEIAGSWSINPQNLNNYVISNLGLIFEDF